MISGDCLPPTLVIVDHNFAPVDFDLTLKSLWADTFVLSAYSSLYTSQCVTPHHILIINV